MDFAELSHQTAKAVDAYRKEASYTNDWTKHFEIRVHPDDIAEIRATADQFYFNLDAFLKERGVFGIPLIQDESAERGHPKLKSTWEWVL